MAASIRGRMPLLRPAWLIGLAMAGTAAAQISSAPHRADPAFDRYATPARLVALPGGRSLNLDCRGSGSPTILLFAGLTGWSEAWVKVHDRLAAHRRVCAFDPAGFGFSGPSPQPQDAAHIVDDLARVLDIAKIAGPFIVVGHSAGGLQALTFVDRHKREVAGMVLVDPSYPGQFAEYERVAPNMSRFFHSLDEKQKAAFARCADALATGPLAPSAPDAQPCFDFRAEYSEKLRAALAAVETASRMHTKIAQIDGITVGSAATVDPIRSYGAMPLIVLTRGQLGPPPGGPPPGMPAEEATEGPALDRAWIAAHEALAKLSTRGEHRSVAGAGHMVQFDRPDAVVIAVEDVTRAATSAR